MAAAGSGELPNHIPVAVLVGGVADMVVGGFGRPHAETAAVRQHEDDVLGAETLRGAAPFVGVKFGEPNVFHRRGAVVVLALLDGGRIELHEHREFAFLPAVLDG